MPVQVKYQERFVVDAWPVLEWLQGRQPATSLFDGFLLRSQTQNVWLCMSRINYGEVRYTLERRVGTAALHSMLSRFHSLPIKLIAVDDDLVNEAAHLKSSHSFSYADAFAAALSIRLSASVVTGDKEFLALRDEGLISLEWLGQ